MSLQDAQPIEIDCFQNLLGLGIWFHINIFKEKLSLNTCMCYRLYNERRSASEDCIIDNTHCTVKNMRKCCFNMLHINCLQSETYFQQAMICEISLKSK